MGGDIAMELYSFEGSSDLANGVDIPPSTSSYSQFQVLMMMIWVVMHLGMTRMRRQVDRLDRKETCRREVRKCIIGTNASLQQGFDEGLKESVSVGYRWGLVRGITSAFACLPDQLKAQMVDTEENRREFTFLGKSVRSVSSKDALKMFNENILMKKESEKQRGDDEEPHDQSSGRVSLESYSQRLELLLEKSPAIKIHRETDAKRLAL
ncbi:hypothetical protein AKJ16_DCAP24570 [Drosera capensis]